MKKQAEKKQQARGKVVDWRQQQRDYEMESNQNGWTAPKQGHALLKRSECWLGGAAQAEAAARHDASISTAPSSAPIAQPWAGMCT